MFCFAYGSNLDPCQIRRRCPSVQFLCVARLKNHRLAFDRKSAKRQCGVANVVPTVAHDAWGVVYQLSATDFIQLDRDEGVNSGAYVRKNGQVVHRLGDDEPVKVAIYYANKQPHPPLPSVEYKNLIVGGAKFWRLPGEYIAELERIKATNDPQRMQTAR